MDISAIEMKFFFGTFYPEIRNTSISGFRSA